MERLLQTIVDGLADGSVYGALALALALVYRTAGVVNFAQGEMAMFSTFGTWALWQAGVPLAWAIAAAALCSLLAGMAVERVAIRPLEGRDALSILMATFGLALVFNSVAGMLWGVETRDFPSVFGDGSLTMAGVRLAVESLGTVGVLLALVAGLWLLLQRTNLGRAMRATAIDREASAMMGIRTGRMLMLGWGLAALVGAIAGALVAPRLFLEIHFMAGVLIYALAAACLGGFDSPFGAVVGGWSVGVCQSLAAAYLGVIGTELSILVPFSVIVLVLLVRPSGLFGTSSAARA